MEQQCKRVHDLLSDSCARSRAASRQAGAPQEKMVSASYLTRIGVLALHNPIACHDKINRLVDQSRRLAPEL